MAPDAWLDATAQAELVRRGETSPQELVEGAIARIEQLDPELNAVIHPRFDQARTEAAGELPAGPFRGVPMLVKDGLLTTAGDPMHNGMRALKEAGWTEQRDSWTAARLRRAGFVFVGKTNLPELATTITTEPLAYGPTRNPWDTSRSSGGSSGGSAAAVASGMVAVAHGTDMGGSIRFPASCCGLVGLKPSRARGTLGPDHGEYWGPLTHEHVLTRSVRDTAAVLDAISGSGAGDPYTAPPPRRDFVEEAGTDPGRLRVGIRTERPDGSGPAHPDCVAAAEAVGRQLEDLGHDVDASTPPGLDDRSFTGRAGVLVAVGVARDLDRWSERLGRRIGLDELEPMNAAYVEMGRGTSAPQWVAALEATQRWARQVVGWWESGYDLLLTPTVPEPPPPLGELGPAQDGRQQAIRTAPWLAFTLPFNLTGQPAISLPLHWNADGLPIGVQLVAAPWREDVLIRVASQLEHAHPWHDRRPPVGAE